MSASFTHQYHHSTFRMMLLFNILFSAFILDAVQFDKLDKNDECGGDSAQACHCYNGKYACLYRSKCDWKSSECVAIDTEADIDPYTQATEIPSNVPTYDETKEQRTISTIECGDTIHKTWSQDTMWRLNIHSDTSSLVIDACHSNFDTILDLYPLATSTVPIIASENDCSDGIASIIEVEHGLSAGDYYLSLSAKELNIDGTYDIFINCVFTETEEEDVSDKTHCEEDCDAFKVEMMYYDALTAYDTDYISNISAIEDIEDVICYTYKIERMFDDSVCREAVHGIVLGACDVDEDNNVDDIYLNTHIVPQIGGDLYHAYSHEGIGGYEAITGIKLDIFVDDEAVEFTLCLHGANNKGILSDSIQFMRGTKKTYLCEDQHNDGLPCFYTDDLQSDFMIHNLDLGLVHHENSVYTRILWVIFFMVMSIMGIVSSFYHIIIRRARMKKPSHMSDLDWTEIKVSDTATETEQETDFEDRYTEKDPLDPSTDCDKISELSGNEEETQKETEKEKEDIHQLKQAFDDLRDKFKKHTSAERVVHHLRSYRNSVCSTVSETDDTTILPLYHNYDVNTDDVGYWANTDVYSNNE